MPLHIGSFGIIPLHSRFNLEPYSRLLSKCLNSPMFQLLVHVASSEHQESAVSRHLGGGGGGGKIIGQKCSCTLHINRLYQFWSQCNRFLSCLWGITLFVKSCRRMSSRKTSFILPQNHPCMIIPHSKCFNSQRCSN